MCLVHGKKKLKIKKIAYVMLCFWFGEKSNIHDTEDERERELCVHPKRLFLCMFEFLL
jgi:hypothetical protein